MPLGAFISSKEKMSVFTHNPVLGHITTFGGHPISCAAGIAAMKYLLEGTLIKDVQEKEALFVCLLTHPLIRSVNSAGLWMAVQFDSFETCKKVIDRCIKKGVVTDWFLFAPHCLRIAPPLIITEEEIRHCCQVIVESCTEVAVSQ